MGEFEVI